AYERSPCHCERPQSPAEPGARSPSLAGRARLGRDPRQSVAANSENIRLMHPLCHARLAQVVQGVHLLTSVFDEVSFRPHPLHPHLESSLFRAVSLPYFFGPSARCAAALVSGPSAGNTTVERRRIRPVAGSAPHYLLQPGRAILAGTVWRRLPAQRCA